jgi:hypothetical protein
MSGIASDTVPAPFTVAGTSVSASAKTTGGLKVAVLAGGDGSYSACSRILLASLVK